MPRASEQTGMCTVETTSRTDSSATGAIAWAERQCARGRPGALEHHVLEIVLDQLAYARAAVDMWDDLQEKVRRRERHLSRSRRIGCI